MNSSRPLLMSSSDESDTGYEGCLYADPGQVQLIASGVVRCGWFVKTTRAKLIQMGRHDEA